MNKLFADFKKFISRGNIIDLAIAVSVGAAFSKIAISLVKDLIMPFISIILGQEQFSSLKIVLKAATETTEAITFNYGSFIQTIFEFFVIAFFIFIILKIIKNSQIRIEKFNKNGGIKSIFIKKNSDIVGTAENGSDEKWAEQSISDSSHTTQNDETISKTVTTENPKTEVLLEEIRDLLKSMQSPVKEHKANKK